MLERTNSLIQDVSKISDKIAGESPSVISEYLVKIALIYFNLDIETALKDWLRKNNNLLITKISGFNNMRDFCSFYNNNFNNPNIEKLKKIYEKFDLCWPEGLADSDVINYNNIIEARNAINHDPYISLKVDFAEIRDAFETAEKILGSLQEKK